MGKQGLILVTGGAGYIGCHLVHYLLDQGHEVLVLDDLSNGHAWVIPPERLIVGDVGNPVLLTELFASYQVELVCHLAASIAVGESTVNPGKYYRNNVSNTLTLLDAMVRADVKHLIFPSTCAVYGEPAITPIPEIHPLSPISPYGVTKLMVERILQDYRRAHDLQSVVLRFFNAAGADPQGRWGEDHHPETHLIPLVMQAALGQRPFIQIHGDDYPTPDGTCIRDYIHVLDLAKAFLLAWRYLQKHHSSLTVNLGNQRGFSVREVIEMVRQVSGRDFQVRIGPRRPGDPPALVGSADLAMATLGWTPDYPDLHTIISHAWQWHARAPISEQRRQEHALE
ncbi:MAG: UDP-glucose 4-epimerase GalE [Thermostichales cyanobacterium SZTDM-1c_bins_54]